MGLARAKKLAEPYLQSVNLKQKNEELATYRKDPVGFIKEILKVERLTLDQEAIVLSVRDHRVTNVKAAHGVGKSFIAACLVLWHVFAVGGLAITSAPSEDQVKEILWMEVRRLYDANSESLGGDRGVLYVRSTETARAYGFTSRDYDSNSFQGKHGVNLLVILDEANGITEQIDDGARSCATGSRNRLLRIGNPLSSGTPFEKACKANSISIPVWHHPNVDWAYQTVELQTSSDGMPQVEHRLKPEVASAILRDNGEVKPQEEWPPHLPRDVVPGAASIEWIEESRSQKGEGSPFWQSRVNALFPEDDTDGIILRSLLEAGRRRYDADPEYWDTLANKYWYRVGTDVANGGDNNAIAYWKGPVLYSVKIHPTTGDGEDTLKAADLTGLLLKRLGPRSRAAIDNGGCGAGTFGILQRAGHPVIRCDFGSKSRDQNQFDNLKIELYWDMREGLRSGKYAIAPLGDQEDYIFADLSATRYIILKNGNLCCEPKPETIKRLKRSPDSEAAVIALKIPQELAGVSVPPSEHGREEKELLPNRLWDNQNLAAKANEAARAFDF